MRIRKGLRMSIDQTVAAPRGQQKVLDAWSKRLRGRSFITCEDIDIPAINRELASVAKPKRIRYKPIAR